MVHNLLKFLKNLRTNQSHLFDWNRKQLNDSNSLLETKAPSPNQEILENKRTAGNTAETITIHSKWNHWNDSIGQHTWCLFCCMLDSCWEYLSHGSTNCFVARPLGSNWCEIFRLFLLVRSERLEIFVVLVRCGPIPVRRWCVGPWCWVHVEKWLYISQYTSMFDVLW